MVPLIYRNHAKPKYILRYNNQYCIHGTNRNRHIDGSIRLCLIDQANLEVRVCIVLAHMPIGDAPHHLICSMFTHLYNIPPPHDMEAGSIADQFSKD